MLTLASPAAKQPPFSKTPLWPHQLRMLQRCLDIERAFKNNGEYNGDPQAFGIMADKPGTGKTFVVVSLILSDLHKHTNSNKQCNLIVVPQNIYTQWDEEIKRFCDTDRVNYKTFVEYSDISGLYAKPEVLVDVDIILTTSLYYHMISGTINTLNKTCGLTLGRVFFDEIDSINSMLREPIESNFTWFVSASFRGDKIGCYTVDRLEERACKCQDELINASFNLYPPKDHKYLCKSVYTEMLIDILPEKKIAELNAMDFNTNIYKFITKVPINERDFVYYLLKDIEEIFVNSRTNIENLAKTKMEIVECGFYQGPVLQNKIRTIMIQASEAHKNIVAAKGLKETIYKRLKERQICCSSFVELELDNKLISNCCQCIFSKELLERLKELTCPNCEAKLEFPNSFLQERKLISTKTGKKLEDSEYEKEEKEEKEEGPQKYKLEVFKDLIEILVKKNTGNTGNKKIKIIIFSDFPNVFKDFEGYFEHKEIKFVSLDGGSVEAIDKAVKAYKDGDATILLADSSMYGCGLNFENTTDIILIHKINPELEKQVIGRAQRPGRSGVLRIHRLLHTFE
jgi:SNF2 family DNA or RNA helicase